MVLLKITFSLDPTMYGDGEKLDPDSVTAAFPKEQAEAMAKLPGLIWKLWTLQAEGNRAGGFYLYSNRQDAERRAAFAEKHFTEMPGLTNVEAEIFDIVEDLTRVTRGPIDLPANPSRK